MLPNALACLYHLPLYAFLIGFHLLLKNQGKRGAIWQAVDVDDVLFLASKSSDIHYIHLLGFKSQAPLMF